MCLYTVCFSTFQNDMSNEQTFKFELNNAGDGFTSNEFEKVLNIWSMSRTAKTLANFRWFSFDINAANGNMLLRSNLYLEQNWFHSPQTCQLGMVLSLHYSCLNPN